MKKYKIFNQFEDYDCASAALCMFLYEKEHQLYSFSEIKGLLNTTYKGTSIKDIHTFLENKNYKVSVCKAVKNIKVFEELKIPFITQIYSNETLHYITVFSIKKNKIIYGDPMKPEVQKVSKKKFLSFWNPYIISSSTNKEKNYSKNNNALKISTLIKNDLKYIIPTLIFSTIAYIITIIIAGMYTVYFDNIIPSKTASLIMNFTGIYMGVALLQFVLEIIKSKLTIKYGNSLNESLIKILMKNFFNIKYDIINKLDSGELITRFSQIDYISEKIVSLSQKIPINILIVVSTTIVLFNKSFYLSLIIFIPMILYLLIYVFSKEKYEKLSVKLYKETELFNIEFIESIENISTIKSYNMAKDKSISLNKKLKKLLKTTEKFSYYDAIMLNFRNSIQTIFSVLLFSVGAYLIIIDNLAEGEFLMFNALVIKILDPFTEIVNLQSKLQQGEVAQKKFDDILLATKEFSKSHQSHIKKFASLKIKKLNYFYGNNNYILKSLDLEISPNEKVAIIGGNGNGKTTLSKILSGLITDYGGNIFLNNIDFKNFNDSEKRGLVSYITEHVEIFSGSVLENIFLEKNNNPQKMEYIFKELAMDKVFSNLEDNEKTRIGENGSTLSKGQLQILNICRAFNKNSILHVYDEATSGLDIKNKNLIEKFLLEEKTTKIFITHDLTFAQKCDRVYLLSGGKLLKLNKNNLESEFQ